MIRIGNKYISDNKNVKIGLTSIYGIGRSRAGKILDKLSIGETKKIHNLSEKEINSINIEIRSFSTGEELKEKSEKIVEKEKSLGSYRGLRFLHFLPARGQRTRTNARTTKNRKKTKKKNIANKKKPPTPK